MTAAQKVWSTRPQPAASDADDEVMHLVCCADDDLALCSTDVSGQRWGLGDQDCVVCADIERTSSCPKFERCSPVRRVTAFIRRRGR